MLNFSWTIRARARMVHEKLSIALSIAAVLSAELISTGVTQDSSDCSSVGPLGTCTLIFNLSGTTPVSAQNVRIYGSNTSITQASITVDANTDPTFTLTPNTLIFQINDPTSQSMTVSTTSFASLCNIQPDFTSTDLDSTIYVSANTCYDSNTPVCITYGQTCQITYTVVPDEGVVIPKTSFPVLGTNTATETGNISIGSNYLYLVVQGQDKVYSYPIDTTTGALLSTTASIASQDTNYFSIPLQLAIDSTNDLLYVTNRSASGIGTNDGFATKCAINALNGSLSSCQTTQIGYASPAGVSLNFYGNYLLISEAPEPSHYVFYCDTTNFTACSISNIATDVLNPTENYGAASASNSYAYFVSGYTSNTIGWCAVNSNNGTLSNCEQTSGILVGGNNFGIVVNPASTFAYVTNFLNANVLLCTINVSGTPTGCTTAVTLDNSYVTGIAMNSTGSYLYIADYTKLYQCSINGTSGALTCANSGAIIPSGAQPYGLGIWDGNS